MKNKTSETPIELKRIVDNLLTVNQIEPEELAEVIHSGFKKNAGHKIISNKGLYYCTMREIYFRCKDASKTFDEWILSHKWELV
jgi:hypothetical protein